jgi:hypothetical protein
VKIVAAAMRFTHLLRVPVMFMLGFGLLGIAAYSQENATIVGTVTDPSGAVVPNAKETITDLDNGFIRSTLSNSTGNYTAPQLAAGHYELQIEAKGFKTFEQKGIVLEVGETRRVDAALQVGTEAQSVSVEATALQIQADTSDVSETITPEELENLGTNGRNIKQLALLVPGAASNLPDFDSPGAQFQSGSIQFNGMRSDDNNWMIDGGEAYDRGGGGIFVVAPSQDAIQELTVSTSDYAADLGNSSGGMMSVTVKNGTKKFHGAAWEYDRNDALDAYQYFAKNGGTPGPKAELRYNAFGFNGGGPVAFKAANPKTFFFYNMEWRREINGGSIHNLVPSAANFGFGSSGNTLTNAPNMSSLGHIYVPNTTDPAAITKFTADGLKPGQEFPNDTIPLNLIDANAQAYLNAGYFLPPNDGAYYYSTANQSTDFREEIVRVDHQFNEKNSIFGSWLYDSLSQASPTVAWTGNTYPTIGALENVPSWAAVLHYTAAIRPNLLNELAYNENGNDITLANSGPLVKAPSGWAPTALFPGANVNDKIPGISIGGGGGPIGVSMDSANWPWQNWWRSNQIKDDLSWTKGAHNFKFGGSWLFTRKKQVIFDNIAGEYSFQGQATACAGPPNCDSATQGIGLADFMLGDAASISQPELQDFVDIAFNDYDAYALDNWRINHRLTLNLGWRWEMLPHAYDLNGRASNFYPNLWNPADTVGLFEPGPTSGTAVMNTSSPGFTTVSGVKLSNVPFYMNGVGLAGRNGIPRGLTTNHWDTMGPRIGFEYDLFGNHKTVLRSGFGTFFERNAGNEEYNMGTDVPFVNSTGTFNAYLDNPAVSYATGANAGSSPTTPQGFTGVQSNLPISTIYQFNFGIQQQMRSNVVASVAYVGNTSFKMSQTVDINTLPASDTPDRTGVCGGACGYASAQLNPSFYRPYLGFNGINLVNDEGNSHYEGLQATLRATAFKGLSLDAAYTYSHMWDVIDAQLFNNIADPMNPRYSYGTGGFDRRQIAVVNFEYLLPMFGHSKGLANTLVGGWTISGIASMESGNPITINAQYDNLGFGGDTQSYADKVGTIHYHGGKNASANAPQYFNPVGTFAQPAALTWGDASKNDVKGPGEDHWNLSLFKDFKFGENAGFKLIAESYNVWNHATFNSVDTSFSPNDSHAGAFTNTGDPREYQLGAKIYF